MGAIKKDGLYQFKSNHKLFEDFGYFKARLDIIAGIVQNDHQGTGHDLQGWVKATEAIKLELNELIIETQKYIAETIVEVPQDLKPDDLPPEMEGEVKAKIVWEDDDGNIHKELVTMEEYEALVHAESGGACEILKHPNFPADK